MKENKKSITDADIYKWLNAKKYQHQYDEAGEYKMLYEIDFPKIIRDFINELYEKTN